MDRSRCLDILEVYGVGTRDLRLFRRYWEQLHMVARVGGHYGETFCRERGITQGDPLSPTIFNLVVDVIVRHWESLVAERAGRDISDDDKKMAHPEGRTIW